MSECKIKKNMTLCNCSYTCSRKGICCECLSYHRIHNEVPACFFSEEAEKTYDRSVDNFIKIHKEKELKNK